MKNGLDEEIDFSEFPSVVLPSESGKYKCVVLEPEPEKLYLRFADITAFGGHNGIGEAFASDLFLDDDQRKALLDDKNPECMVKGGAQVDIYLEEKTMNFYGHSMGYKSINKEKLVKCLDGLGFSYDLDGLD